MKILAVEDDAVSQLLLRRALERLGHQVVLANDGESAWAALADPELRVVVSDWRLPRLNGLELCQRIRARRSDYVCFLLLTQNEASDANLEAAIAAGVDEFLTKPVEPRELKLRLHVAQRIVEFTTELRRLESFLPICGYCKKIRRDQNYWQQIEAYLSERAGTRFSHGVCPECYNRVLAPELRKLGLSDLPPAPEA